MIRGIAVCVVLLSISTFAMAGTPYVTGSYEPVDGGYRLYFTLHNPLEDEAIWYWYIATEDAFTPFGPPEWTIYHTYRDVQWRANSGCELQPGQSLGGFGYTAEDAPGVLSYYIGGEHGYVGEVTMELIPEPSSLLALCGGIGTVGLSLLRRRRRQG